MKLVKLFLRFGLDKLELLCYLIPGECTFNGVQDRTPEDYEPRIKISVKEYKEDE